MPEAAAVPEEPINVERLHGSVEIQEELKGGEVEEQRRQKREELRAAYIESYRLQDEYDELTKLLDIRDKLVVQK